MNATLRTGLRLTFGALTLIAVNVALTGEASAQAVPRTDRVVEGGTTRVTGLPDGPGTFYVVNRETAEYTPPERRTSFVPRIVDSVRRQPF